MPKKPKKKATAKEIVRDVIATLPESGHKPHGNRGRHPRGGRARGG